METPPAHKDQNIAIRLKNRNNGVKPIKYKLGFTTFLEYQFRNLIR